MGAMVHMWRPQDNSAEPIFSFHHVVPGIDPRLEGLAASTFISQAALLGLDLGFK